MTNPANELIARWRKRSSSGNHTVDMQVAFTKCADELAAIVPEIERLAKLAALTEWREFLWDEMVPTAWAKELDSRIAALTQPVPAKEGK